MQEVQKPVLWQARRRLGSAWEPIRPVGGLDVPFGSSTLLVLAVPGRYVRPAFGAWVLGSHLLAAQQRWRKTTAPASTMQFVLIITLFTGKCAQIFRFSRDFPRRHRLSGTG